MVTAVRATIEGSWDQMVPTGDVFIPLLEQHPANSLAKRNGRTEKQADGEDAKKSPRTAFELRAVPTHLQ